MIHISLIFTETFWKKFWFVTNLTISIMLYVSPVIGDIIRFIQKVPLPPEPKSQPPSQGTPTQQQEYIAGMIGYMMNTFMYMMPIMMTFMSMTMITNLLTKTFTE